MSVASAPEKRPEDENLGIGANLAYGLQHVLTMYGGIVAVPLIVGQAAGLSPSDIGLLIAASMTGRRHALTDGAILRAALAMPLLTLKVVSAIHWEALKLWLKRVPLHSAPAPDRA